MQWEVLERPSPGTRTLVLIGDPKQAIYAFRGGDVATYLAAAADRRRPRAPSARNWRSDAAAGRRAAGAARRRRARRPGHRRSAPVDGAPPGQPAGRRAVRRAVAAAGGRAASSSASAARRTIRRRRAPRPRRRATSPPTSARLLASRRDVRRPTGARPATSPCSSRRTTDARACREALGRRRHPGRLSGDRRASSRRQAARGLAGLLEALEQPHRSGRVRAAALTLFFGETAAEPARRRRRRSPTGSARPLRGLGRPRCATAGVAALFEAAQVARACAERVLAWRGGERQLTDLRHVGAGAARTAHRERLGLPALVEWLREESPSRRRTAAERTRRLDSDAAAVQIMTVHASKGLQYPVVYLPFGFDRYVPDDDAAALPRGRRPRARRRRQAARRATRDQARWRGRGGRRRHPAALRRAHPRAVARW